MELLPEGQNNSSSVTLDDQLLINKFSTLMTHYDRLNDKLSNLQQEKDSIDDITLELELIDEDELIDYLIGGISNPTSSSSSNSDIIGDGCFVKLKQSKVMENLQLKSDNLSIEIDKINENLSDLSNNLKNLKSTLYAKFGNAINLER